MVIDDEEFVTELEKDSTLVGIIGIKDKVKANTSTLIDELKSAGVKVILCSGDGLNITKCFAEDIDFLEEDYLRFLNNISYNAHEKQKRINNSA